MKGLQQSTCLRVRSSQLSCKHLNFIQFNTMTCPCKTRFLMSRFWKGHDGIFWQFMHNFMVFHFHPLCHQLLRLQCVLATETTSNSKLPASCARNGSGTTSSTRTGQHLGAHQVSDSKDQRCATLGSQSCDGHGRERSAGGTSSMALLRTPCPSEGTQQCTRAVGPNAQCATCVSTMCRRWAVTAAVQRWKTGQWSSEC